MAPHAPRVCGSSPTGAPEGKSLGRCARRESPPWCLVRYLQGRRVPVRRRGHRGAARPCRAGLPPTIFRPTWGSQHCRKRSAPDEILFFAALKISRHLFQGNVYNTVHKWTEADGWVLMECRGVPPAPRWTHTAVEYQGGMYVFGGFYGFGGQGPTVRRPLRHPTPRWAPARLSLNASRHSRNRPLSRSPANPHFSRAARRAATTTCTVWTSSA